MEKEEEVNKEEENTSYDDDDDDDCQKCGSNSLVNHVCLLGSQNNGTFKNRQFTGKIKF